MSIEELNETTDESVTEQEVVSEEVEVPKFGVISIEKTDTPDGMTGDNWYKYIIGQGASKIQGLKIGTLDEVSVHANNLAEDLNSRSKGGKTGYTQRQNKNIPAKPESKEEKKTTS